MYVGMALAWYWDEDWTKYSDKDGETLYAGLRDARGYDELDDYVVYDILKVDEKEGESIAKTVGECAARTLSALSHSGIEPGTKEASQAYIASLHALYTMGVAMELNALGYHMTKLG